MAGALRIRAMTSEDVPWAIALTDTEGWGYSAADLERLLYLEPDGILVAEADGSRMGMAATTTYGRVAYVGAVIVDPARRGTRVGTSLVNACLAVADRRGVESVRLNAYVNTVPFYERIGFQSEYENRRFHGENAGKGSPRVRPVRGDDMAGIARLDTRYFGAERAKLVGRLREEFPRTSLVFEEGGAVVAYGIGNTSADVCEVGPFVCPPERPREAEALLYAMFGAARTPCAFSMPAVNVPGIEMAHRAGMHETFRTVRMVRGSAAHGGDPSGVFALGGLEKG